MTYSDPSGAALQAPISTLEAALAYAAEGFAVFPLMPGSKQPFPGTRGLLDASTDPEQIRKWWEICPEANIGIAVPDGYAVIDVDPRNGGAETIDALERERGDFPPTRVVRTGGFGLHLWYRLPPGQALPKLGDGVDVQQLGKYVVAPPSLHESGRRYEWRDPHAPIADAPAWLAAKAYPRGERAADVVIDETDMAAPVEELDRIAEAVAPHFERGKRHQIAKNIGGWMKQRGYGAGDVAYVIGRLPSDNPRARTQAALAAFGIQKPFGWTELQGLIPEACPELERAPNPVWEARLAERRAAAETIGPLVERMTAAAAPAALPPAAPANDDDFIRRWDLAAAPPPVDYVVPALEIGPGRATALIAYAHTGKTPFALRLAVSVASGKPFIGMAVVQGPVLFLDCEAGRTSHRKLARIARAAGVDLVELQRSGQLVAASMTRMLHDAAARDWLARNARRFKLIMVDSYSAAVEGVNHNDNEFADVLRQLGRISDATGATVLPLMHVRKEGLSGPPTLADVSGHNTLGGAVQAAIGLWRPDPISDPSLIEVTCARAVDRAFRPFRFRCVDVPAPGAPSGAQILAGTDAWGLALELEPDDGAALGGARSDALQGPLLELLRAKCGHAGLNQSTIEALAAERGWGRNATRAALGLLESTGAIYVNGGVGRGGKLYHVRQPAPGPFVAPAGGLNGPPIVPSVAPIEGTK